MTGGRIRRAVPADQDALFDVWLRAVQATHTFVKDADIQTFKPLVRHYLASDCEIWVLVSDEGTPLGFMGLADHAMESLFIAPEFHRRGGGRRLVEHARSMHDELTVNVNEQNLPARHFYESCGFVVEGRSELDETGRPYPILHMRLRKE